jgi:putative Mg2+ transporter-C (MgtC) family protein
MESITIPNGFGELALRLTLAALLGAAVGLNRELQHKPAGLRTHALVSLGVALAVNLGLALSVSAHGDAASTSRILQGIVAGIGFVGGGVILHRGRDVQGLTTAASVWVVAAVGAAAGLGLWRAAAATSGLALVVLIGGTLVERILHSGDERQKF